MSRSNGYTAVAAADKMPRNQMISLEGTAASSCLFKVQHNNIVVVPTKQEVVPSLLSVVTGWLLAKKDKPVTCT